MKNISIYCLLLLVLLASCKDEKELKNKATTMTVGALTISTDQPKPGETIDIAYNSAKEVEGFYTYMVGTNNYPVDIDFKSTDTEQKSSIKIPDSALALAFFIKKDDDKYDNNKKEGYLIPLYNNEGKPLEGSSSAMAYYKMNFGADYGIKIEKADVTNVIKSDLEAHPNLKSDWEDIYLGIAYKTNKEAGKKAITDRINALSSKENLTVKEYASLRDYYYMLDEGAKGDSISKLGSQKFPKSELARNQNVNDYFAEKDLVKKEQIFNDYKMNNPKLGNLGNYMANNLAMVYYNKKDMVNFDKYSNMVDDKSSRASSLNNLAWEMAEKGENLNEAEKMSKTSLDIITSLQDNPSDKPEYFTKKQYEKNLNSTFRMYADTYALILFKQGKIKEAIDYQEKAFDAKSQDDDANARYIEFLMTDKQYDKAIKKSEEFIAQGHGNEKLKKDYKIAYLKANPNDKNFDAKLKELEVKAEQNAVTEIKKSMLDEEAPTFTLKDLKGEMVSLESLKGKTVILDFWATWCGPCKASFPGMQEVVAKYKDDASVKLLFIDTFEAGKDREQKVVDFIKKNKYDFHVIYDSEDSEIAGKYGITGIPTKVVIGPDGRMKFKSVGFSGSNQKLVKEMDMMIAASKS